MSSLLSDSSQFQMNDARLESVLAELLRRLSDRVQAAYVFGSAATGEITKDSDIDLILVHETQTPFLQRAFEFADLFEVYPKLDVLVYTERELNDQLADSSLGFWKSVRLSMRKIL